MCVTPSLMQASKKDHTSPLRFGYLPEDIALRILALLDYRSIVRLASACRLCRDIVVKNNDVWRRFFERDWGELDHADEGLRWKKLYDREWRFRNLTPQSRTLWGHSSGVSCLKLVGSMLVTGSWDGEAKVWDLHSESCMVTFHARDEIHSLTFDGSVIVAGLRFGYIQMWSLDVPSMAKWWQGHCDDVSCIDCKGSEIASGSLDGSIKVWDMGTKKCVSALKGHRGAVTCLQFYGRLLVTGSDDRTVRVWDYATQKCLHTLTGHLGSVTTLCCNRSFIVSGSSDSPIKVWNVATWTCDRDIHGHSDSVSMLEFDSFKIVSASYDGTVKVWDMQHGGCLQTLQIGSQYANAVSFDEKRVICGCTNGDVVLWDFGGGRAPSGVQTLLCYRGMGLLDSSIKACWNAVSWN